jgi:hypothetical protein
LPHALTLVSFLAHLSTLMMEAASFSEWIAFQLTTQSYINQFYNPGNLNVLVYVALRLYRDQLCNNVPLYKKNVVYVFSKMSVF